MVKYIYALIVTLTIAVAPGCVGFGGALNGVSDIVTIKKISVLEGITVSVRGYECTFGFTRDRAALLEEVKDCVTLSAMHNLRAGAVPLAMSAPLGAPDPIDEESIELTDDILTRIELSEIADHGFAPVAE